MRRNQAMFESTRLVTAEELARLPDDGYRYELVEGRLIRMSPASFDHGRIVLRIGFLLSRHLEQQPVGVIGADIGFKLASNPDTVRGPDIAFIKNERVKIEGYLTRGVSLVVVIDFKHKSATLHRPAAAVVTLRSEADVLDLGDVIPGFRCQLREIFQ
jgi:Uma2 family endonuclease